ncbi:helix-turn-helix transcriptional regulator [Paraburkholderia bryophila]|uniref:Putative DNA-binding transcriptional regulator AlpA n=1 Tax=Paraburkholderia bryophila TaxID=420952 RepID=A0A7Y9WPG5_9BURK|nr:AlpA family transcriptional regulator [Paraburkholderia bryophila]NYH24656.1 putative DNA-binding transcriptional regulator AlpA [Paraburkholderia bryophila]
MTHFFGGMDSILGHRTARRRERHAHVLHRLCEARNEAAMQSIGGGSADTPAPRAPRTQRRTARKPAGGDGGDSEGEPAPARHSHVRALVYSLDEVAQAVSLSTGNVQKLVREGSFPKPRAMSARRVGWIVREVEAWVDALPISDMLPPKNCGQRNAA